MADEKKNNKTETKEKIFIGVDFGTSKIAITTNDGKSVVEQNVVGYPKDPISSKFLKKEVLYGNEALKHRVALNIFRPIENGILKTNKDDISAAKGLLEHCINSIKLPKDAQTYAILGVPAEASVLSKKILTEISKDFFTGVMVASDPFCVAYELGLLENVMIVDIGAGTTDLCRVRGTLPEPEDMMSFPKAGDTIDNALIKSITSDYTNAVVTKEMAKRWKEEFGFVGEPAKDCVVEVPVDSSTLELSITQELKTACESIIPAIVEGITKLISTYDPDFREELRKNIFISGGGSLIRNIDAVIEEELAIVGGGKVTVIKEDPFTAGSKGALKLAIDMPDDYWGKLV
ncbi:MAG: rod shape-determining protein [ANME-2 cluster archaeon]|nr:rod shape-determining protein [ANME-2 cluster archaeon]